MSNLSRDTNRAGKAVDCADEFIVELAAEAIEREQADLDHRPRWQDARSRVRDERGRPTRQQPFDVLSALTLLDESAARVRMKTELLVVVRQ